MIELKNFSIRKDNKFIVKDLNLTLNKGQILGIAGNSGIGKTITALQIAGIEQSGLTHYGEISKQNLRNVGILFQNPLNQIFSVTVYEEIKNSLFLNGCNTDKETILQTASKWELSNILNNRIDRLSLGEAQRVAIASIMISKPDLIILDEPFQYVHNNSFKKNLDLLKKQKENLIIIIIEHNYHMLNLICDKILLLKKNGYQITNQLDIPPQKNKNFIPLKEELKFSFENVSFSYSGFKSKKIFNKFNYEFDKSFLIIDGKNGSGKSTFVKLLSGLLKPNKGKIRIKTRNEDFIPTIKKSRNFIGYIFQNPDYQIFSNTVKDEIFYNVKNYDKEYYEYWIRKFGLLDYLDSSPHTLSYGERRRLNFLSATIKSPMIIIYDEPTVGLDYKNRKTLIDFMEYHNQRGKMQILISHDRWFKNMIKGNITRLKL